MPPPTSLEAVVDEFGESTPQSVRLYDELAPAYAFTMEQRGIHDAYFDLVTASVSSDTESILELACGDGSLLAMLDRRYERVLGIDRSAALLSIARTNAAAPLVRADVRQFRPGTRFDAIAMVGRSLAHLLADEDVRRCFETAHRSLADGGRFVFDSHDRSELSTEYAREREFEDDRYRVVQRTETAVRDSESGIAERTDRFTIERLATGESATLEADPWEFRAFDRPTLTELLSDVGFAVRSLDSAYGGHQVVAEK